MSIGPRFIELIGQPSGPHTSWGGSLLSECDRWPNGGIAERRISQSDRRIRSYRISDRRTAISSSICLHERNFCECPGSPNFGSLSFGFEILTIFEENFRRPFCSGSVASGAFATKSVATKRLRENVCYFSVKCLAERRLAFRDALRIVADY